MKLGPANQPKAAIFRVRALKAVPIEVHCDEAEKQAFRAAAEAAGLPLSGWIRERLRRVARKELEDMDMPVAFLERLSA